MPGFDVSSWYGLFAPAKTPDAIVQRLSQETVRYLKSPDARQRLISASVEVVASSPDELTSVMKNEIAVMGRIIREAGIRAE
mgnify:CR=1 FL=1